MFIKPFFIYLKISETFMKIYEFSYKGFRKPELVYDTYYESRRNAEDDVWGHLWEDEYANRILVKEEEFRIRHDYYDDSYYSHTLDKEYGDIRMRYNPYAQNTLSGERYLMVQNWDIPAIELSSEEVDKQLKEQLYKWVDSINIVVR